jgi:hypothetical protein
LLISVYHSPSVAVRLYECNPYFHPVLTPYFLQ